MDTIYQSAWPEFRNAKSCQFAQKSCLFKNKFNSAINLTLAKLHWCAILCIAQSYSNVLFRVLREVTTICYFTHSTKLQQCVIWRILPKVTSICYFAHYTELRQCALSRIAQSYINLLCRVLPKVTLIYYFAHCAELQQFLFCRILPKVTSICYFAHCAKLQQCALSCIAQSYIKRKATAKSYLSRIDQSYISLSFHALRKVTAMSYLSLCLKRDSLYLIYAKVHFSVMLHVVKVAFFV